jgi:hypothetical protein
MTESMTTHQLPGATTTSGTLGQVTGAAGIITLVVVLGSSLANNYQSAQFTSDAQEALEFFGTLDDSFGAASSFLTSVGLIAMLWFGIGLALLLRPFDGELPWRSAFLAGAGVVAVVSGQIASWDAAVYRSDDLDPQIARYAFDLGNLSFANGWVATGALAICAGSILITHPALPSWLGWWAVVAGVGSVLARAVWTEGYAMLPVAAFWVWTAVLSVWLVRGGLAARSTNAGSINA